jgi:5,10-methylenetetrahydromethanopterin reductase
MPAPRPWTIVSSAPRSIVRWAIGAVRVLSEGRVVLGIGRGDSARAHLGRAPAGVDALQRYTQSLQRYLRGER